MYKEAMKSIGMAKAPEDLVEGLSQFFKDVGYNNSFIDAEELKTRGEKESLWLFL